MMFLSFFTTSLFPFLGFDIIKLSIICKDIKKLCKKRTIQLSFHALAGWGMSQRKTIQIQSLDLFDLLFHMFHDDTYGWEILIDEVYVTSRGCQLLGALIPFIRFWNCLISFPVEDEYFFVKKKKFYRHPHELEVYNRYNLWKLYRKNRGIQVMKLVVKKYACFTNFPAGERSFFYSPYNLYERFCCEYSRYVKERFIDDTETTTETWDTERTCFFRFMSMQER